MGKLRQYWDQLQSLDFDDPRRKDLQKKINDIEKWMIENKIGDIKETTKWNDSNKRNPEYPHHTGSVWFKDTYMLKEFNSKGLNVNKVGEPHKCDQCNGL